MKLTTIFVRIAFILNICAIVGSCFSWQMPYRLSSVAYCTMTYTNICIGWLLFASLILGIVSVLLLWRSRGAKANPNKQTHIWAGISLVITFAWILVWSLSASIHAVNTGSR